MNPFLLSLVLFFNCSLVQALTPAEIDKARTSLYSQYQAVSSAINNNAFGLPLTLKSSIHEEQLTGQIIGVLGNDFTDSVPLLDNPEDWCEILMLHINIKACTFENGESGRGKVHLYSGRKFYQTPQQATKLTLDFSTIAAQDNYLSVMLFSDTGPLGTRNYLIELEVMPLPGEVIMENRAYRTLIRMTFSYRMSWHSRLAVRLYLATLARNKVGFTVVRMEHNQPVYIQGLQGIIERNTTRYYLAIKTKLDWPDSNTDPLDLFSKWFDATQRYKRQLYEVDKSDYLQNKTRELQNQRQQQAIINPITHP